MVFLSYAFDNRFLFAQHFFKIFDESAVADAFLVWVEAACILGKRHKLRERLPRTDDFEHYGVSSVGFHHPFDF